MSEGHSNLLNKHMAFVGFLNLYTITIMHVLNLFPLANHIVCCCFIVVVVFCMENCSKRVGLIRTASV